MTDFEKGILVGMCILGLLGLCATYLTLAFDAMGGFDKEGDE